MDHACHHESTIAAIQKEVENLKGWQKTQNGSILKVEAKIDKLIWWIMAEFAGVVVLLLTILLKGGN